MRTDKTILVTDDEFLIRALISEVLDEAGFAVIEASDGPSALDILRSSARVDLLVTDIGLPGGMNGHELAAAGRTLRPELGVLFITGHAHGDMPGVSRPGGNTALITKPFELDTLTGAVTAMILQSSAGQ